MNHIYRSLWSEALGTWIAVSEISKGQGKRSSNRRKKPMTASPSKDWQSFTLLATSLLFCSSIAWALPTGDQLVAGQASVSNPAANVMQIDQTSQKAAINWQGFSVGQNEAVNINQPNAQAALLNRVVGQDASQIQGQINANGQVYIVNPNGVIFGKTAQVDVGGLIATTHDISNQDFMAGKNHFTQNGATGSVENHGTINAKDGGVVALIGEKVTNTGNINTPKGTTALAAGKTVDLDFKGDGLVEVKVTEAALNAQITNHGAITADGGRVVLSAKAAGQLIDTVINQDGIIKAQGLVERNGEILLDGGDSGTVQVSGTVDTSSNQGLNASTTGGNITVKGAAIELASGANINATGNTGGGAITIGDKQTTQQTTIVQGATVTAQTLNSGKAGTIKVLANMDNGTVNVAGKLDASAPNNGDGGFIDTSAAKVKIADTAKISTHAKTGKTGAWLIDPVDFTIAATGGNITGAALSTALNSNAVTILAGNAATSCTGATCTAGSAGVGDINVNDVINWSGNSLLTLNAWRNININANITGSGTSSKLLLLYGQNSAAGGATDNYFVNGGTVNLSAGQNFSTQKGTAGAVQNYTVITSLGTLADATVAPAVMTLQGMNKGLAGLYVLGANIDASPTSTAPWGTAGFMPVGNWTAISFTGKFDGLGHTVSGLSINRLTSDYVGLFGSVQGGGSVSNIGLLGGSIVGRSYVGGLVGYSQFSSINNAYATGSVTGTTNVGGLVGYNDGSTINNAYATGRVTGTTNVGGLVGYNSGIINNSFWDTITTGKNAAQGIGFNNGGTLNNVVGKTTTQLMTQSTYTGWDFANTWWMPTAGGNTRPFLRMEYSTNITNNHQLQLMGMNLGANYTLANNLDLTADLANPSSMWGTATPTILTAINTGFMPVGNAATWFTGKFDGLGHTISGLFINRPSDEIGLFGWTGSGTISNIGMVGGSITGRNAVGELIGRNTGSNISNVYTTGNVTASACCAGGLVGYIDNGSINNAYATGSVTGAGGIVGGLVGLNLGTISNAYATGLVTGGGGGLVGQNGGMVSNSFWNTQTTGQATSAGGIGKTTAQMMQATTFTPWSISNLGGTAAIWRIYEGHTAPLLASFMTNLTLADAPDATVTYNGIAQSGATTATIGVLGTAATGTNAGFYNGYYSTQQGYNLLGGNLIINKADYSKITGSKTYNGDANFTNIALTGVNGESFTVATATANSKDVATANTFTAAGAVTGNAGALTSNYNLLAIASLTGVNNVATITPKTLTATVTAPDKVYDGNTTATPTLAITATDLIGLETVTATGAATFNFKDVLTANLVTVNSNTLADGTLGGLASNYSLGIGQTVAAYITPADLTVTANFVTKFYDGTTSATGTGTVGAIAGAGAGETVLSAGIQTYLDKNVGIANKVVSASGVTIKDATNADVTGNYIITYIDNKVSTITAAALNVTVTATTVTKTYDGTTTATGTGTVGKIAGVGDSVLSAGIQAFLDKNVGIGNKTVRASGVTIQDLSNTDVTGNYIISYTDNYTSTINPAVLTVTAGNVTKTYNGTSTATGTGTVGTIAGKGDSVLNAGIQAFLDKNVGIGKTVRASGVTLKDATNADVTGNYTISYIDNLTSTINKAALSITANADSKLYDGLAYSGGNGVSYAGFVNGEGLSVLAGALAYGGNSQGAIQAGTYSIIPEGLSSGNYAISYLNGNLVITQTPDVANTGTTNQSSETLEKPIVQVITKHTDNLEEQRVPLQVATTFTEGNSEKVDHDEKPKPSRSKAWIEIENGGIRLP